MLGLKNVQEKNRNMKMKMKKKKNINEICRKTRTRQRISFSVFNPKRHGLFGLLDTWGGWNHPTGQKCSITPPNFIPKQQTVSHMKAELFS